MRQGDTDHELVAKSLQGNQKAFGELLSRHHATAYSVVRSVLGNSDEVEDVLQGVYVKIYKGLASFRGDAKLSTWIYRIARNESINAVKKRCLETTPVEDVVLAAPDGAGPEAGLYRRELSEQVEAALDHLDEGQRTAIELRYMGDRSYEEIAETMGIPLGTVKTYIHRGKAQLKKALGAAALKEE